MLVFFVFVTLYSECLSGPLYISNQNPNNTLITTTLNIDNIPTLYNISMFSPLSTVSDVLLFSSGEFESETPISGTLLFVATVRNDTLDLVDNSTKVLADYSIDNIFDDISLGIASIPQYVVLVLYFLLMVLGLIIIIYLIYYFFIKISTKSKIK